MKAYTYHTVGVPDTDDTVERRLIADWRDNWTAHGFEPVVLTQNDVRRSPHWFTGAALFRSLKKGRLHQRSMACFQRWMAYDAVVRHLGVKSLMMDYDVRNNGFSPEDVSSEPVMFYDVGLLPSVVSTNSGGSGQLVQTVLGAAKIDKEAFLEDSIMFQRNRKHYKSCDMVKDAGESPDWRNAKLIHYALNGPIERP